MCSADVDKDAAKICQQQGHAWKLQVRKLELITKNMHRVLNSRRIAFTTLISDGISTAPACTRLIRRACAQRQRKRVGRRPSAGGMR